MEPFMSDRCSGSTATPSRSDSRRAMAGAQPRMAELAVVVGQLGVFVGDGVPRRLLQPGDRHGLRVRAADREVEDPSQASLGGQTLADEVAVAALHGRHHVGVARVEFDDVPLQDVRVGRPDDARDVHLAVPKGHMRPCPAPAGRP